MAFNVIGDPSTSNNNDFIDTSASNNQDYISPMDDLAFDMYQVRYVVTLFLFLFIIISINDLILHYFCYMFLF